LKIEKSEAWRDRCSFFNFQFSIFNFASNIRIINDEDQVAIMVAVLHLDIHAGIGHAPRGFAELARLVLTETLHEDFVFGEDSDSGGFERGARGGCVFEEKVRDGGSVRDEDAAAFDADAGAAEGLAHFGEGAGAVLEGDGEVLHERTVAR